MIVLAIDTSTAVASVAVLRSGEVAVERAARSRGRQGEVLLPLVDDALRAAELTPADVGLVAVGIGPGGFTSLRIGLATAKGLALAHGAAIVGVPSARVVARAFAPRGVAAVLADAQRGEVFASVYDFEGAEPRVLLEPILANPDIAAARVREAAGDRAIVAGGDAFRAHGDVLVAGLGGEGARLAIAPEVLAVPRAAVLAAEAIEEMARRGADDLAGLEPMYVRPSDAKLPAKALRVGRS